MSGPGKSIFCILIPTSFSVFVLGTIKFPLRNYLHGEFNSYSYMHTRLTQPLPYPSSRYRAGARRGCHFYWLRVGREGGCAAVHILLSGEPRESLNAKPCGSSCNTKQHTSATCKKAGVGSWA